MVLAILQARYSSTRLPGKILKAILDRPMLVHQIERIQQSKLIDHLIVATSDEASDNIVEDKLTKCQVEVFRGNLRDVLDRYYRCAVKYKPAYVVRITGDCPLIDWTIIDEVIRRHIAEENDYTCNGLPPTYPDGLDVEVMNFEVLKNAWCNAELPSEREHVTPYIYNNRQLFKIGSVKNSEDLSMLRWTVDEPDDFRFVTKIYEALYKENRYFAMMDILKLLKAQPELTLINSKFTRNEGYMKSLAEDELRRP